MVPASPRPYSLPFSLDSVTHVTSEQMWFCLGALWGVGDTQAKEQYLACANRHTGARHFVTELRVQQFDGRGWGWLCRVGC